nr:MAG TPA: hypothetical protein [Caudoviricetes sp.]
MFHIIISFQGNYSSGKVNTKGIQSEKIITKKVQVIVSVK